MSKSGAKQVEGASVEAPHLDAQKGDTFPTRRDEIPWVTTPIDVGALSNNFFRVSVGNPSKRGIRKPHPGRRPRGKRVGCRTTTAPLLSTVRRNYGPTTVKASTSQTCVDSRYHQGHGIDRCPKHKRLCHSWPGLGHPVLRSSSGASRGALPA